MKLHPVSARILSGAILIGSLAVTPSALAATLSLESVTQYTTTFGTPVDLTDEGTLDWAYWSYTDNPLPSSVAPSNEKLGGSLIGNASAIGFTGSLLRGSPTANADGRYSFSNGASPVTGTNIALEGLLFNNKLNTEGAGLTLQITGDPEVAQYVRLYLGGFGTTGKLTLTLAGATTIVDSTQVFGATNDKDISVYTVRFQPDAVTDLLTVTYTALTPTNASAHVGLEAVTVSNIPEPGSALLLGIGAIALAGTRRRRA